MNLSRPIQQAALILSRLDPSTRDAVLDRMPHERAYSIREAMQQISAPCAAEQEVAIREFLARRSEGAPRQAPSATVDIRFPETELPRTVNHATDPVNESICDLLQHADESLARVLAHERTSTIAAILSAIPGHRAAGVLRTLDQAKRIQVLAILDAGVEFKPKAIEAVAEWICDYLAATTLEPSVNANHRSAIKAILDEFNQEEQRDMLADLARENPLLARRLAEDVGLAPEADDSNKDCYC